MRLPGVAITAIFTCGIAFGLHPAVGHHVSSLTLLWISFSLAVVLISAGFIFAKLGRLFPAAAASLLSWVVLGFLGACIAEEPRPAEHVISLVEQGRLALETPLRWHGRLRDEPKRLPWGYGYEIELSGVEYKGASLHVLGGLRLGFSPQAAKHVQRSAFILHSRKLDLVAVAPWQPLWLITKPPVPAQRRLQSKPLLCHASSQKPENNPTQQGSGGGREEAPEFCKNKSG